MLRDLRGNISNQIQEKQIRKQKLFDEISKIDSELLELNEILVKISTDDAFYKISPNEAFEILDNLGYKDNKEKLEMYVNLLTNKDVKAKPKKDSKESNDNKYIEIINNSFKNIKEKDTVNQNKKFKKIVKLMDESFKHDNYYYYVDGVKVSKFRLFYNLVSLLGKDYKDDEIVDVFNTAFCYRNVKDNEKNKVYNELKSIEKKLIDLF